MTIYEVVKEEAAKRSHDPDDNLIEHVVWAHTGYPSFWNKKYGSTPEECFRNQVIEYFEDPVAAEKRLKEEEQELIKQSKEEPL